MRFCPELNIQQIYFSKQLNVLNVCTYSCVHVLFAIEAMLYSLTIHRLVLLTSELVVGKRKGVGG